MTPKDLIERTNRVKLLQGRLSILNSKDARITIFFDKTKCIIRTQNSNHIFLNEQLEDFAKFVAETIRTKVILDIEQEIKQLCNLQEHTPPQE